MLNLLLSLSVYKFPLYFKIYLNIIPVLIGLFFWIKNRIINLFFFPIYLIIFYSGFLSLYQRDLSSLAKLGQLGCILGFIEFSKNYITKEKLFKIFQYILAGSTIIFLIEVVFMNPITTKNILNIPFPQYRGPVGEPNYSALLLAIIGLFFFIARKYLATALSFLFIILSASRSGFIVLSSFIIFYQILHLVKLSNKKKVLFYVFLTISSAPILIFLVNQLGTSDLKAILEKVSAGRFYLWVPFIEMGMDNIFGVGYMNGTERYHIYMEPYRKIIDSIRGHQINEQHNFFIHIFSEFGPTGYFLSIWQFSKLYFLKFKDTENGLNALFLLTSLFFGYSFLNGLNEFIFYLIISYLLSFAETSQNQRQGLFFTLKGRI